MDTESANAPYYRLANTPVKQFLGLVFTLIPFFDVVRHANSQHKPTSARTPALGRKVTPRNRCAHPGACGNLSIVTHGLIGCQSRLRNDFLRSRGVLRALNKQNCMHFPPLSPPASWPTSPKNAKKGRKSAKALGQRPMAKRPLARRGSARLPYPSCERWIFS